MDRDLRRILMVQALRAFAYGLGSVLIGSALAVSGLSAAEVGAVFTSMLAGMALSSLAVARWGERVGRRRCYAGLLALMGVAGTVFALTSWLPLLVAAALTGTLSTDPNESGPITSLEQAMLGGAPADARARVFGRYNAVAFLAGSVGALAAGGPAALRGLVPSLPRDRLFLLAFPVIAAAAAVVAMRLSPAVEGSPAPPSPVARRGVVLHRSKRTVRRLAALFAVDSFGGGFVVQSFMVFWFRRKFGVSVEAIGLVFFAAGLLQAASSVAAGRLAGRIGLLNTMVFTHLPSNVLLAMVPFMPSFGWAAAVLLARFALSQMDVPARQAYVAAMVAPDERTAAAAYTNTARYLSRPVAPLVGGALMRGAASAAPFVLAGAIKVAYDLAIYLTFRRIPPPEDR